MPLWLILASTVHAKPTPMPTECPWSGAPQILEMDPNSVNIGGVKYKVGGKNLLAFANLLTLCNANQATPLLSVWQKAQNEAATQVALMTASGISWASKISQAQNEKQKNQLAAEAAAEAAAQAVVLKQLNDAAKAAKDEFMLALMATTTTTTTTEE